MSEAQARPLIQARKVAREFGAGDAKVCVLSEIDLTIHAGEMVAIIGQSGSGKSTLMNILGALDTPTTGEYLLAGQSVASLSADQLAGLRRERFGFIFQRYQLLSHLSATANVAMPAVYRGIPVAKRNQRAEQLLARLGLADKLGNCPNQLSGGQQQRVSIARALMNGGQIIFADEPTGALDSQSGHEVMAILKELHAAGHTIILVTHDPAIAAQAERVIELKDGRIISDTRQTSSARSTTQADQTHISSTDTSTSVDKKTVRHPIFSWLGRLQEAFYMSLLSMRANKMRTLLTMLGIIIGIASVVTIVALGRGSQAKILADISSLGTNTITVVDGYPWGDPRRQSGIKNLTSDDARAIASQPYTQSVSPQLSTNMTARYRTTDAPATVVGVGAAYLEVSGETLAQGQMFDTLAEQTMAQDVVIDDNAYQAFFDEQEPLGAVMQLGQMPVRVIGVLTPQSGGMFDVNDSPTFYVPYTTLMSRTLGTAHLDRFMVRINDDVSTDAAEAAIRDVMLVRRGGEENFRLRNSNAIRETVESTTATMTLLVSSIAIISLVVGGIGVMNIMLVSVTERTGEIGVRMAVGARQSDILQQFLIEAVLVCLLGGILGVLLSLALGFGINQIESDNVGVSFSVTAIVAAFVCSSLIGIVFGFLPARRAARLSPVAALARE